MSMILSSSQSLKWATIIAGFVVRAAGTSKAVASAGDPQSYTSGSNRRKPWHTE